MKTISSLKTVLFAVSIACLIVAGCKKEDETPEPEVPETPQAEINEQSKRASEPTDVNDVSSQAMDDVNATIGDIVSARSINICGLSYFDTANTATTGVIHLYYSDSVVCNGDYKRSGHIQINLPVDSITDPNNHHVIRFSTAGAVAKITFDNYKVERVSTGKSVTFNGWHTMKNKNQGGWVFLFLFGTPVEHEVRAFVNLTYENGDEATWNAATERKYTYVGGVLKATMSADSTIAIGGITHGLAFWGVNRTNEDYTITMPAPLSMDVINPNNCIGKLLTGGFDFRWSSHVLSLTYGVDASGVPTTNCPYGYKISWTDGNGNAAQHTIPY